LDAQDNLKSALKYINFKVIKFDNDSSVGKTSRPNRFSSAVVNKNLLIKAARMEKVKQALGKNCRSLRIGIAGNVTNSDLLNDSESTAKTIYDCLKKWGESLDNLWSGRPGWYLRSKGVHRDLRLRFISVFF